MSQGARDNFAFVIKFVGLMIYSLIFVWFCLLFFTFLFSSPSFFIFLIPCFSSSIFLLAFFFFLLFFSFYMPFFSSFPFFSFPIVLLSIGKTCFHNSQGIMLGRSFFHSTNCCWL
jgi:hypothetical protein